MIDVVRVGVMGVAGGGVGLWGGCAVVVLWGLGRFGGLYGDVLCGRSCGCSL